MDDHRLYGMMIAPGASHIALILTAAKEALGVDACVIENLFFPQALVLSDQQARTVQLILSRQDGSSYAFQILSLDSFRGAHGEDAWIQHAVGGVRITGEVPALKPSRKGDVERIKERCHRFVSGERFHREMWDAGYTLGPPFRWIAEAWRGEKEILCRFEAPRDVPAASTFQLYPGLIDSCFQSLLIDIAEDLVGREYLFVPFHLERFALHAAPRPGASLYCHTMLRGSSTAHSEHLAGELVLFDGGGTLLAEMNGLEIRKASRKRLRQHLERDLNELLYQTVWQEKPITDDPQTAAMDAGSWLIVSDAGDLGARLAARIREAGGRCQVLRSGAAGEETSTDDPARNNMLPFDPADGDSYRRVLNAFWPSDGPVSGGVVHLSSLDGDTNETWARAQLEARLEGSCGTLLRLLQAITQSGWAQWPQLNIITRGARAVRDDQANLDAVQTPIWGLAGVMAMEHPDLRCRSLDLDPTGDADEAAVLFEELRRNQAESQVGYRQGSRYVARLKRYSVQAAVDSASIRADASYLITGGLGGIGLTLAEWLAERGARHLLLVGRNKPSAAAFRRIEQLEAAGSDVSIAQADVADLVALRIVLDQMRDSKSPLRGIIHAAGVLDDGALVGQTWDGFLRVMAPKVVGTWNLHLLSRDLSLDFFVCFSSLATTLGAFGQGNYAAANAFMDGLMHRRRLQGLPGLSINWGPWSQVGMAAALNARFRDAYAAAGIGMLTPAEGLRVLDALLGRAIAQVGVWPINWSKFARAQYRADPPPYLQVVAPAVAPPANEGEWVEALTRERAEDRRAALESFVRRQVADVLRLEDTRALGPRERFFDFGLDSLMAVDLKNQLQLALGRTLRSTVVFDYPTVQALVNHLINDVVPAVFAAPADETAVAEYGAAAIDGMDELSERELADLLARELAAIRQNDLR
jgi:NAD(P)-dependent dehydrogenase (short-subunit alcohol dehydrogenase family)